MKPENPNSKLIWNSIREIMKSMKNESNNISFKELDGGYSINPSNIRWKNFFLNNLFWGFKGKSQRAMIILSDKIKQIADVLNYEVMNVEEYVNILSQLNFSIYLTDFEENRKELQDQLENEDYVIITQKDNKTEELITTIVAKLFFIKEGYLVGDFDIPSLDYWDKSYGLPDIIGVKGDFVNKLKSKGIMPFGGDESDTLIWKWLKYQPNNSNEPTETIVCEVKSSSGWSEAYRQLYQRGNSPGYLKSHCFNKGYACFSTASVEEAKRQKSCPNGAKFEAGSLIFVSNKEPVFNEDPIYSNPSSYRKNTTLLVKSESQKHLINCANNRIARLMISNLSAIDVFKHISKMKINEIFGEINKLRVEDILNAID